MKHAVAVLACTLALAGCLGQAFRSDADAPTRYRLDAPSAAAGGPALAQTISVARPRAAASLDTDRIAVTTPGHGFDYLVGARWSDPAPQLLQSMLVAALAGDAHFAAAVAMPSRVATDYVLDVGLTAFEARYAAEGAAPTVTVAFTANLLDARSGRRVASVPVAASADAARNDRGSVVAAFQQAASAAARDAALAVAAQVPRG
ncbi:MAG: ABC-type transport auxiliary lipoprotein family protein [Steroidobacteraceae bacterium]